MIIGIEGALGSGKTVQMIRYLYKDKFNLGNEVKTNFKTVFSKPLDILGILGITEKTKMKDINIKTAPNLNNVSIGIDEITVFMDCRRSQSKMNLLLSYFILQTRKRNVQLYYTTQDFGMIDTRLFAHTHIMIIANFMYDENENEIQDWREYSVIDLRNKRNIQITRFNMKISNYYDLYDTNEIILPPF